MASQGPAIDSGDKQRAEVRKAELENKALELQIANSLHSRRWEIAKTIVPWLGVLLPLAISLSTYFGQKSKELEQKAIELRDQRNKEIAGATDLMNKGDRSSGVLLLSIYGEDAIPIILGEVRVHRFHVDWPSPALAALTALKRIGVDKLRGTDIDFLRLQISVALDELRSQDKAKVDSPTALGQIQIIGAIEDVIGHDPIVDAELTELKEALVGSKPQIPHKPVNHKGGKKTGRMYVAEPLILRTAPPITISPLPQIRPYPIVVLPEKPH